MPSRSSLSTPIRNCNRRRALREYVTDKEEDLLYVVYEEHAAIPVTGAFGSAVADLAFVRARARAEMTSLRGVYIEVV